MGLGDVFRETVFAHLYAATRTLPENLGLKRLWPFQRALWENGLLIPVEDVDVPLQKILTHFPIAFWALAPNFRGCRHRLLWRCAVKGEVYLQTALSYLDAAIRTLLEDLRVRRHRLR